MIHVVCVATSLKGWGVVTEKLGRRAQNRWLRANNVTETNEEQLTKGRVSNSQVLSSSIDPG
jgi:hypothetical protein